MLKMLKTKRFEAATAAGKTLNAGNIMAVLFPAAAAYDIGIGTTSAVKESVRRNGNLVNGRIR